ncbi:hypothetical protein SAY87_022144 [Trapa incisa]|uniref:Uncharacterized protein n=1 Tax=Trapa incisa TaxID=236973 RepID=A0AAN7PT08_9MYRT|nr:hypothetical protein SAY87_022144 [Trapa incisa]
MGGRAPCCDKNKVKRGSWSHAEDQKLISFISQHGHGNWRALPRLAGTLILSYWYDASFVIVNDPRLPFKHSQKGIYLSIYLSISLIWFPFYCLMMSQKLDIYSAIVMFQLIASYLAQ